MLIKLVIKKLYNSKKNYQIEKLGYYTGQRGKDRKKISLYNFWTERKHLSLENKKQTIWEETIIKIIYLYKS